MVRRLAYYAKNLIKYIKSGGVILVKFNNVSPNRRFNGKRVLVTGGSSGIGFEIARQFLAEGATVIITGRHKDTLDEVARKLDSPNLRTMVWDVADVSLSASNLEQAADTLGGLDICVNNAGIFAQAAWDKTDADMYDAVTDINTRGLFFLCQAEGKYFVENKTAGRIVNICSIAGIKSGFDPYSVSKWGSVCITKGLAKELVGHSIIVNGVAPGNVVTNIHDGVRRKQVADNAYTPAHLTKRYTLVEEVAGMVLYLASDLGSNIVGHVVPIDGGWTLR